MKLNHKILFIFFLFLSNFILSQNTLKKYNDLIKKADTYYRAKNYKTSASIYSQAFKLNHWKINVIDGYNAASLWALANEKDSAFYYLNYIVKNENYTKYEVISNDKELENLHKDKRWKLILLGIKANIEKKEFKLNKPLIAALDSILDDDQKYREEIDSVRKQYGYNSKEIHELWKIIDQTDSANLQKVEKILDTYGWLGEDILGKDGNATLFLVIQHSDLRTQLNYLPIMRDAVKKGNAKASEMALLEDRIALGQGKKQIYGSQLWVDSKTGKDTLAPIEDLANVNKRRAEVGLEPLEEYLKGFGIVLKKKEIDEEVKEKIKEPLHSNKTANKPSVPNERTVPPIVKQDCKDALQLKLQGNTFYGPTNSPLGFGSIQEITQSNNLIFEEEHNSAWYLLLINSEGELAFDIIPTDTTNDYDFLLYEYSDTNFCELFQENKLKPLRSNLSNIIKANKGITGLNQSSLKTNITKGIGNAFSKSIKVKAGEKYMLILDNVTPKGKGHKLVFDLFKHVEIKGTTINSDSIPTVSEIRLYNEQGNLVLKSKSDKNGSYNIQADIKQNRNYNLTLFSDSTFIQTRTINTKDVINGNIFPDIKTVLPKLKKGEKYKLGNINFYGNSDVLLPTSYPSVDALTMLMKKNKKMIILIEGHTNGEDWHLAPEYQHKDEKILSEKRAQKISDYLIIKGINKNRFSSVGRSSTLPVYMNPVNESQESANRRVEIKIISLDGNN